MKIAVTHENGQIFQHFGNSVVEVKSENYKHEEDFLDRLKNLNDNLK